VNNDILAVTCPLEHVTACNMSWV